MAGGRKDSRNISTGLKWQSFQQSKYPAGRKPLPNPITFIQLVVMLVMHICRKIVLFQPEIKIGIYVSILFFVSLVCDFVPFPESYFSRKDNLLNEYLVKLGWGWTLTIVGTFVYLTSWTYCCSDKVLVRQHLSRMLVGTVVWFFCTTLFQYMEEWFGHCYPPEHGKNYKTKGLCRKHGLKWVGFDISGHAFLLIYCCLIIMEEGKCIRGWERIGELIVRNNEFEDESPLKKLSEEQMYKLKTSYEQFTPYVRVTFVFMTVLLLIWDVMLMTTILYYHNMVQKLAGGLIAIGIWFITYRIWYRMKYSPGLPGEGLFKYSHLKSPRDIS
ncbi:FIT family protein CG10671-like [Limulus polyphemus]|uniref:FIT family protein CG10671-like n=1 Tax=Limulus polyphemus TaxID=6850 RepID=A0ABM1SKS6_LIMPO|nr:FIT family protein CG10671-like [Limulus polyphemus]